MKTYPTPPFKIGDRVAYSVQWLKSVGMEHTDLVASCGTIDALEPLSQNRVLAYIVWDGLERNAPRKVLTSNLAIVGHNPRFANID